MASGRNIPSIPYNQVQTLLKVKMILLTSHDLLNFTECGGNPLVKQVVTLSFNAKVDLANF